MLDQLIAEKIKKQGPISFRDFMDMSLYYPQLGYYTSPKEKIGKRGDFYTSPSFDPIFGQLVARQMEEMWSILGEEEFTIVEYGAGPGFLCRDILGYFSKNEEQYKKLHYFIIEKSPFMIEAAKKLLPEKVQWCNSISEIRDLKGCVLSNELVDNFSVHRVEMHNELQEVYVDHENDFKEVLVPAVDELRTYFEELRIQLPKGFKGEVNMQASAWMKEISESLKKGFVLTIDYGYPASELFYEFRSGGTMMCFYKHHAHDCPYKNIGEQDITAHVNFSALCLWGYKNGLSYCGFTDQCRFLLSLGFYDLLKMTAIPGQDHKNYLRERTLTDTLLREMGYKFKVLVQCKGLDAPKLKGLGNC